MAHGVKTVNALLPAPSGLIYSNSQGRICLFSTHFSRLSVMLIEAWEGSSVYMLYQVEQLTWWDILYQVYSCLNVVSIRKGLGTRVCMSKTIQCFLVVPYLPLLWKRQHLWDLQDQRGWLRWHLQRMEQKHLEGLEIAFNTSNNQNRRMATEHRWGGTLTFQVPLHSIELNSLKISKNFVSTIVQALCVCI